MAQVARRRPTPVETVEEKIARLDKAIADAYDKRDALDEEIADLEVQLEEYQAPMDEGDFAKNRTGARVKVIEVAPAFGSWVARVVFVDGEDKPKDGKVYTYDVADLTLE